ncbi:MAG: flagellar biosynthesis anti-sigma factor FlgM [Thermoleophilia bacterium]|nr:flagellar biosynthesis anti-sigma factor FlgM [Thermoleophilia bacterium]
MSDNAQKPEQEITMGTTSQDNRCSYDPSQRSTASGQDTAGRLQAIHELIRSGDYHVPASAIADRMVERMIAGRRRRYW